MLPAVFMLAHRQQAHGDRVYGRRVPNWPYARSPGGGQRPPGSRVAYAAMVAATRADQRSCRRADTNNGVRGPTNKAPPSASLFQ